MTVPITDGQLVMRHGDGRTGRTIDVIGVQDPRVFTNPQRLMLVRWDDNGGTSNEWSTNLEVTAR